MSVWPVPLVDEQPEATLESWNAYEVQIPSFPNPTRHLAGYAAEDREGRVTSSIVEFDPTSRKVRTASGRVYRLSGGPGANLDADYVWGRWVRLNEAQVLKDVTVEFRAAPAAPPSSK
jgi:hypothetical protein